MSAEKRISDLEAVARSVKSELTEDQRLAADRYITLLVRQQPIPRRLRAQFMAVPKEGPLSPALEAMIADVMGTAPALPAGRITSWRKPETGEKR